jgi:hypothetical protein
VGPSTEPRGLEASGKKAYMKPCLKIYGRIEQITRSTSTSTTGDNSGHKANNRTGG